MYLLFYSSSERDVVSSSRLPHFQCSDIMTSISEYTSVSVRALKGLNYALQRKTNTAITLITDIACISKNRK